MIFIKNGRVIDPARGVDRVEDVLIEGGKIAAAGEEASARAAAAGKSGADAEKVTYKVGTEPTFPPFDTTDEEQNIVGLDMDLIKAIGEDQGFEVTFENLSFDGLVPALKAGNIDIIAAGMNKDDKDRQAQVDFSDAYYESKLMVAVTADNETIKSVDDLTKDMKVAAQTGTTGANKTQKLQEAGEDRKSTRLNSSHLRMSDSGFSV